MAMMYRHFGFGQSLDREIDLVTLRVHWVS
jgi:hypothetical protein